MRTLFMALAILFFSGVDVEAGKQKYELNQPFEIVILKLSAPGADSVMIKKGGGELIKKDMRIVGFVFSPDGFHLSITHDTVVKRDGREMNFKEVVIFKKEELITTTELVSKDEKLDKYLLVTTIKRVGDKTVVEHDLKIVVDGVTGGVRYIIAQRIALSRIENGVREIVGEPRPKKE